MSEIVAVIIDWPAGRAWVCEGNRTASMDLHMLRIWLDTQVIRRAQQQASQAGAEEKVSPQGNVESHFPEDEVRTGP